MRLFISCILLFFVLGCASSVREVENVESNSSRFQTIETGRLPGFHKSYYIYTDQETDIDYLIVLTYRGISVTRLWKRGE